MCVRGREQQKSRNNFQIKFMQMPQNCSQSIIVSWSKAAEPRHQKGSNPAKSCWSKPALTGRAAALHSPGAADGAAEGAAEGVAERWRRCQSAPFPKNIKYG